MGSTPCTVVSYPTGDTGVLVCNYGTANQHVVEGLDAIQPPAVSRNTIEFKPLGSDFPKKFAGGGTVENMSASGALVLNDLLGQELITQWMVDKTELKAFDLVMFINDKDFFATDLARDCSTRLMVTMSKLGKAGADQLYPYDFSAASSGPMALFTAHIVEPVDSSQLAFVAGVAGADDTITDAGSRFITAGFRVGQSLLILNSTTNDEIYTTVKAVVAGTLTLNTQGLVDSEAGANGMEIHGGNIR